MGRSHPIMRSWAALRRLDHARGRYFSSAAQQQRNLNVGVLKEQGLERRVTMVPAVAQKFIKDGYKLTIEEVGGYNTCRWNKRQGLREGTIHDDHGGGSVSWYLYSV